MNIDNQNLSYEIRKELEKKIFENLENGLHHNPYDQELRELSAIERGDLDALKESLKEAYSGKVGTLSKNPLRNQKNNALVV
nr:hypothetical protein [Lachnospiraceae bacterium]